jgi:hypothetical protein
VIEALADGKELTIFELEAKLFPCKTAVLLAVAEFLVEYGILEATRTGEGMLWKVKAKESVVEFWRRVKE